MLKFRKVKYGKSLLSIMILVMAVQPAMADECISYYCQKTDPTPSYTPQLLWLRYNNCSLQTKINDYYIWYQNSSTMKWGTPWGESQYYGRWGNDYLTGFWCFLGIGVEWSGWVYCDNCSNPSIIFTVYQRDPSQFIRTYMLGWDGKWDLVEHSHYKGPIT